MRWLWVLWAALALFPGVSEAQTVYTLSNCQGPSGPGYAERGASSIACPGGEFATVNAAVDAMDALITGIIVNACAPKDVYSQGGTYPSAPSEGGYVDWTIRADRGETPLGFCQTFTNDYGFRINGVAAAPTCAQGQTYRSTVRMGWARTAARSDGALWATEDGRTYLVPQGSIPTAVPTTICDGQCEAVADGAAGDWWYKTDPSPSGLHGIYREQTYAKTGATCSVKTPALDHSVVGECDGYVGEVNGQTKCIAKEAPSVNSIASSVKATTSTVATTGTPTQVITGGVPQVLGPNGENPGRASDRSGLVDLSGTGKSPTPGPSTGTVTRSDGITGTVTFDLQTCGVPGKPACKLDESGTPSNGAQEAGLAELKSAADQRDGFIPAIESTADKDTSWAMPAWVEAKACAPWSLGTFHMPVLEVDHELSLNICPAMPYVTGVLNFMWVFWTFLAVLGMVGRTVGAGVH